MQWGEVEIVLPQQMQYEVQSESERQSARSHFLSLSLHKERAIYLYCSRRECREILSLRMGRDLSICIVIERRAERSFLCFWKDRQGTLILGPEIERKRVFAILKEMQLSAASFLRKIQSSDSSCLRNMQWEGSLFLKKAQ